MSRPLGAAGSAMRSLMHVRCSFGATGGSGLLSLGTARLASLDDAGGGVLDVLLGRGSNEVGWDVDHLLANGDVSASDQDASVVNRRGQLALYDEGLQTTFHELSNSQTEDVIELAFRLLEETKSDHTSDDGLT